MAATSQPISIVHNQRSGGPSSHNTHALSPTLSHLNAHHTVPHPSPHHSSQSSLLAQHAHLANPRWAGTSPRSAESSTSWAIHPGPLFVSAGSLGSTSGSFGAVSASGSVGSMRSRMYPGCSPGVPLLNPLEPDFKYRGVAGSIESDHGSLINPHMSEREVEQFRNFTCCGLPLTDLHALVEHFEAHHVFVDSLHPLSAFPPHPSSLQVASGSGLLPNPNGNVVPARSTDSSLAGALGPSSSPTPNNITDTNANTNAAVAPPPSAFDPDDMDLDMEMEMELEPELEVPATSPAPSNNSSASSPNSNSNSNSSTRSSPLGGGAGPLPLTQPQRFANVNSTGANRTTNGTRSSVSSPPDTPLLTTPVSPFATAPASATTFPWAAQAHDGLMTPIGPSSSQTQSQTLHSGQGQSQSGQGQGQAPAGPSAFDSVHLPPKHSHGGMFAHPYAGASSARRHAAHPMSPLSSASSVSSASGTTSPSSASASACASGFGYPSSLSNALANGHAGGFPGGTHGHGLHHTQSLYALRLARYAAAEREREREEAQLIARALNGYAGYEDYSRGFPGTGDVTGEGVGIAGGVEGVGVGIGGDMGGMGGAGGIGRMNVGPTESAIHPGLLFGNTNGSGAMNGVANGHVKTEPSSSTGVSARTTPAPSRSGSPSSSALASASTPTTSSTPSTSTSTAPVRKAPTASTTLSRPSSSLLLSKPFKCPTPGCTKSYKQANGLKYHVTHGQCSFTPPPELSSISELGLSIGLNLKIGPMGIEGLEGMSERDRREAEREAERRLRPFCCQVKPCQRRYKNMNGLRYHYQHSGEHGAQGLRMLASGRHDATRSQSVEEDEREGSEGEREREGKEGQTSSAPSTPGPRASQNANSNSNSLFTTQAFAFQQQQTLHQRSLSNSSQPLSPLSQHFPSSTAAAASSSSSQYSSPSMQVSCPGQGQGQGSNGTNGVKGGHAGHAGQYAFAVQSQPASAYASPWGSRAGSPTSSGGSGVNGVQVQPQWGSQGTGQGQGQDAMMAP